MPFGIQPIHLLVIVIVALLIFGPQKLPEIGRGMGKMLNEFRQGTREMTEGFRDEVVGQPAQPAAYAMPQPVTLPPPNVLCPSCGTPNAAGATFCNHCGSRLSIEVPPAATIACPSCAAANKADAIFCERCGTRLVPAPEPAPAPVAQEPVPPAPEPVEQPLSS